MAGERNEGTEIVDAIKRDAVGRVPEHWAVKNVDELIDEGVLDKIKDGNHGSNHPVAEDYVSNGVPFLMSGNIRDGQVRTHDLKYLTEEHAKSLRLPPAKRGDVLLTHKGNQLGRTAIMDNIDWAVLTPQITFYRIKSADRLNARFLKCTFDSPLFQHQFKRDADQSTRPFVSITNQRKLYLPLPPLPEQKAIAGILGALDDKIELNRRMNETLESMARAIFKSWFVDFDPVRAKMDGQQPAGMNPETAALFPDSFEDSELGQIPKGWRVASLSDVLVQRTERIKAGPVTESMPYVPIDCITPKSVFLSTSKPGEEAKSSLVRFYKNDFLFGAMRPYFHKVCIAPFDGTTRTTAFVLHPQQASDFAFGLLQIHESSTIDYATRHSEGSTIPYAKWDNSLADMPIILPSANARRAFNDLVEPMLMGIPPRYFEIESLANLRDTLLPKLLSGELRVPEAEKQVEEIL